MGRRAQSLGFRLSRLPPQLAQFVLTSRIGAGRERVDKPPWKLVTQRIPGRALRGSPRPPPLRGPSSRAIRQGIFYVPLGEVVVWEYRKAGGWPQGALQKGPPPGPETDAPGRPGAAGRLRAPHRWGQEAIKRLFILSYISIQHVRSLLSQRLLHWGKKRSHLF